MSERTGFLRSIASTRGLALLLLIIVYGGVATYYVMSDTSVRGLTLKMFYVSRGCTADSGTFDQVANYEIQAGVWSTHSLRTSISKIRLSLSVDGRDVGTSNQSGVFIDPGNSAPFVLSFRDLGVDPGSLPRSPELILSITATVTAGLITSTLTRSDVLTWEFPSTAC
jgi:hypothetical protein